MVHLIPSPAACLEIETQLDPTKYRFVIGVDEVGRGSWAGPLCVGAVVFDLAHILSHMSELRKSFSAARHEEHSPQFDCLRINDSKLLSPSVRRSLVEPIVHLSVGQGIGMADAREIDQIGMTRSLILSLERALEPLEQFIDSSIVLLDGSTDFFRRGTPVMTVIKGDTKSFAIASSSIIAKVTRDALMEREAENYPWYHLEKNKGYPSPTHVNALHAVGPCEIHRKSWSFMAKLPWRNRVSSALISLPGLVAKA